MENKDNSGIDRLEKIDMNRIVQPAVKKLLKTHINKGMNVFDEIENTYKDGDDLLKYNVHHGFFNFDKSCDDVWEHYMNSNPSEAWNGKLLSFGVLVSKSSHSVLYPGGKYEGAKAGQVLYINLNLLFGQYQLAVSHEIIKVDHENKYMDLSYVKGAESEGMQHIEFIDNGDGGTTIKHTTYYKSDSKFRDKVIYPIFHTLAINDYHNNMKLTLSK